MLTRRMPHLDQGESAFFLRQLESIDQTVYQRRYPEFLARQMIPTFVSVAAWAKVHTWREWDKTGSAKILANMADDLPMSDVNGKEFSQIVKTLGGAFGYDVDEIQAAAAMNVPLDQMRADSARFNIDQLMDSVLSVGDADAGLHGLLNLDDSALPAPVTLATLATKAKGGKTWGTLLAPNASGQEMANDVIGTCASIAEATDQIWSKFRVVIPIAQFEVMGATRINAINDTTALEWALKSQWVESITPWYRCKAAGGSGTDRMAVFPSDPRVLGGIVPQEFTTMPVQLRNLRYIVNCLAKCGGVICRYPVAMRYADGL